MRDKVVPDTQFTFHFHSPGIEPWIMGILKTKKIESLLDIGCGYGFFGFLIKSYLSPEINVIGIDISEKKIEILKKFQIYNDLIICDVRSLPIKPKSFEIVLVLEVIHMLKQIYNVLEGLEILLKKTGYIIIESPVNLELLSILIKRNYNVFSYHIRGLLLLNLRNGYFTTMYSSIGNRIYTLIIFILYKIFRLKIIKQIISYKIL